MKARFEHYPSIGGMAQYSVIHAGQHTHYNDSGTVRRNRNSTYSSYLSKKSSPHLSFICLC